MVHGLKRPGRIHDNGGPMRIQGGCDAGAIQCERREAGRLPAKGAGLVDRSARDDHRMARSGETPCNASAKTAITAKEQYADHNMRRACCGVGIQQVERRPNSR